MRLRLLQVEGAGADGRQRRLLWVFHVFVGGVRWPDRIKVRVAYCLEQSRNPGRKWRHDRTVDYIEPRKGADLPRPPDHIIQQATDRVRAAVEYEDR